MEKEKNFCKKSEREVCTGDCDAVSQVSTPVGADRITERLVVERRSDHPDSPEAEVLCVELAKIHDREEIFSGEPGFRFADFEPADVTGISERHLTTGPGIDVNTVIEELFLETEI